MDRLEAALVFVGVEQRQLLMAMNHVDGVVEIEDHRLGRGFVALAINIGQTSLKPDQVLERGRVFEPGDRRLRTKIKACFRQAAASQLESRIEPQGVQIIAVFVAAGNGEHARLHNRDQ